MSTAVDTLERAGSERRQIPGPLILAAMTIVGTVVVCALFAPLIAPYDPYDQDILLGQSGPSGAHPLGTDDLGQDTLSRVIYGARNAMWGPVIIAVTSTALGSALGLAAGYFGGRIDTLVMRWVDLMLSIPVLLVAVVLVGVLGGGYTLAVALLAVMVSPGAARFVRASTLEQRPRPYVEAAVALGLPTWRVIFRHVWPNVMSIALAHAFLVFAFSLVTLSGLSFLGLGVNINDADWGRMLAESRRLIFSRPEAVMAPGLAIVLLASSMSLIGDWAYERVSERGVAR